MLTGLHGMHVFVGTVFLIVCLFRALAVILINDLIVDFYLLLGIDTLLMLFDCFCLYLYICDLIFNIV
jgi:hypothetical protein